mmetsp:Transcript_27295/g.71951  ORF Transcript_27295/g.71951 Transcript_27295/m.71951 type:complete len:308 (-) Transcript_27295:105-1028(-)
MVLATVVTRCRGSRVERRRPGWRLRLYRRESSRKRCLMKKSGSCEEPPTKKLRTEDHVPRPYVIEGATPRSDGEGEASRQAVGLKLIGELSRGAWTYPIADEQWRCYAGFLPQALQPASTKHFFQLVKKGTRWLQPCGRWGPLPLMTAWMTAAPCQCKYRYGGAEVLPEFYPEWMTEVMSVVMPLCGLPERQDWPNSCNLNQYVDGQHSVGWHSDNETLFQGKENDCRIISLSLGHTRKFELRLNNSRQCHKLELADGDLCTMEGLMQKHFQHRVPKENRAGTRLNLTWRWVVKHDKSCNPSAALAA